MEMIVADADDIVSGTGAKHVATFLFVIGFRRARI
jgi:hypothetical protein